MSHATNIGYDKLTKNGKGMSTNSNDCPDDYQLQLEAEQRYAIGNMPELKLNNISEQNQAILTFISEHPETFNLEETEISLIFGDFVREHAPVVAEKINQIWKENRSKRWSSKESNFRSWDEIRIWDRTIQCNGLECEQTIVRTPASNDRNLWITVKNIVTQLVENDADKASEIIKLHAFKDERLVSHKAFREIIGIQFDIKEAFTTDSEDVFDDTELFNIFHINRDVYCAMLYLNYCSEEETCCPKCGKDMWMFTQNLGSKEEESVYFQRMAENALQALLTGLLGSSLNHPNKSFRATLVDFTLPEQSTMPKNLVLPEDDELIRDIRQGKMDEYLDTIIKQQKEIEKPNPYIRTTAELRKEGKIIVQSGLVNGGKFAVKRHKAAIAEAFQACFPFAGQDGYILDLPNGMKAQFKESENSQSEDLNLLSMNAINRMATELVKFKPLMFFADNKEEYPVNNQLRWAKKLAAQILLIIIDLKTMIKVNKISPDHLNIDDETYTNEMWMIELKSEFRKKLFDCFLNLEPGHHSSYEDVISDYFNTARVDPMYVPPMDRTLNHIEGGLLTKNAQLKNPLIQNNASESLFNVKRFEPSQKAIDNLNILQKTSWKINQSVGRTIQEILKKRIHKMIDKFKLVESKFGFQLDYTEAFPDFSLSQVREWIESMWLASDLTSNGSGKFWHAWCFDWRGRMYTCSNLLSPQGDDISRGLLQFGEGLPLDDSGWKWLRRAAGRSYLKRSIEESSLFDEEDKRVWSEIQSLLKSKTWNCIDTMFANEEMQTVFNKVLNAVSGNPVDTCSVWGENDIFRKKAEGFQRLALTEAYVAAMKEFEQGEMNPIVSVPIVLDASSNIYQHASCLTQDPDMALAVNVLPNENKSPTDIYQKVADRVSEMWKNENPFKSIGLSDSEMKEVMGFALNRKTAKKPVMTIGYGSAKFAIVPTFLTHNGQKGGINEWAMFRTSDKSELKKEEEYELKSKYSEDSDKKERDKVAKSRMIAHPQSILGDIRDKISRCNHYDVASIIVESFIQAIDEVLNGHSILKSSLKGVRSLTSVSGGKKDYVSWSLNDGSKIRNIVFGKMKDDPTDPWDGTDEESKFRFTIKLHTEERSSNKEASGLPPNFVHSIDACHMRTFVEEFSKTGSSEFIWSVHDAFGSHPNYIDTLSETVVKTFFQTHESSNGVSHLHSLIQQTLATCSEPVDSEALVEFNTLRQDISKMDEHLQNQPNKVNINSISNIGSDDIYLIY